jgi:predicted dehydrogenase
MINIAILGPGKIAPRFVKGAAFEKDAKIYGVFGRTLETAKKFAKTHNIARVYKTLDELLNDERVHLVYIATPVVVHYQQIEACLKAKKHVLCEKPMLVTKEDVEALSELAKENNVLLMEAQKAPYLSSTQWIKKAIKDGVIGEMVYVEASYGYDGSQFDDDHWVWDPSGGGSLWDVGVYPISFFMSILTDDPIVHFSRVSKLHQGGADKFGHIQVQTNSGVVGSLSSSLMSSQVNTARVYGSEGMILVENFWKANNLTIVLNDGQVQNVNFDDPTDFYPYIHHAVQLIKKGLIESPIYSKKDWLKQIELITSK